MITYLIYSSICLGLLLLIYHLLLESEKLHHINRGYLIFSLLFSFTIPLIPVGIGEQLPSTIQSWVSDSTYKTSPSLESELKISFTDSEISGLWMYQADESNSAKEFPTLPLLTFLYGSISLLLLVRLFRLIHMIQMKADRNLKKLYQNCELVLLREKVVPHSFMNMIFVNLDEYESGRIVPEILIHEQAHASQKHTIDLLMIEILKAIFWFNPLLYLYKRAIQLNHEYLADQAVINSGININEYQSLLLNTLLNQPIYGLSHSFTFSLTKKRLQMMTKTISPIRTTLKLFAIIPLFFTLGFLFGCESTPSDFAQNQLKIHIEFTDSEHIIFNGEEITVSDLENKLKSLSDQYELHFTLESHPQMLAGPVMNVNRLVELYRSGEMDQQVNHLTIEVSAESEILVNDKLLSINELKSVLDEHTSLYNLMINFHVDGKADLDFINEVQGLLRQYKISRINYSVQKVPSTEDELLTRLNLAGSTYMSIPPQTAYIDELNKGYKDFMEAHKNFYEEQKRIYSDDPTSLPPPPPMLPEPQVRIDLENEGVELTNPWPPPPTINQRNVIQIFVNDQGLVKIKDQRVVPANVRAQVKRFIDNNGVDPELSISPVDAIVSIKTDRTTPYDIFIYVLDEVMRAYNDLRDEASMNHFGKPFDSLEHDAPERELIREQYPKRIAVAEPNQ